MEVVWTRDWKTFTVADVHGVLGKRREIAYTTVMTTVARLHDKGLLLRERDGKRYVYAARLSREAFLRELAREVFDSLGAAGPLEAAALLVEKVAEAGDGELERIERLIRARRKGNAS